MTDFTNLVSILDRQDPSRVAFTYAQGEAKVDLTFAEVRSRIEAYPLPKEQVIGIFADTNIETIVAIFALAGKRQIVLLSSDDPSPTIAAQIEATHIQKLIGDEDLVEEFAPLLTKETAEQGTNILFFTSGTTSKAKAVVLTQDSLTAAAANGGALLPLSENDSLLSVLPLSHVYGFVCALLWPLSFGAKVCLGRGMRSIFFDFAFFAPTATVLVPQMAGFLEAKNLFNPELKLILIGAGICPRPVIDAIRKRGIRVSFGYGLTETSSGIALSLGEDPYAMSICPQDHVEIAPDGEILVTSSTTLFQGYYEDEEATAKVKRGDTLYTGDLGRLENGLLYVNGRKKEILVFNDGSKLFLPEYERDLEYALGLGTDFAVMQDPQGNLVLVLHDARDVSPTIDAFNQKQARSHRIGRIIYAEHPLPRTKTNKVKRYQIDLSKE